MLNSIHIQNFRLFKEFQIKELTRVNLIVGKNNTGKSSLLEAIHLLISQAAPVAALDFLEARENFASRAPSHNVQQHDISQLFIGYVIQDDSPIRLRAFGPEELALDITKQSNNIRMNYSNGENTTFNLPMNENFVQSHSFQHRSTQMSTSNFITTKGFDYRFLAKLWDRFTLTNKEDEIYTMLQILEPRVRRLSFPSSRESNSGIRVKLEGVEQPIPLTSMGEGMHRILIIAAVLADSEDGYLLVDEIDTGLHYRTITDMWRLVMETAVRLNVQVFATTHSLDCIRSFAEALVMQDDKTMGALFRLQRRDEEIQAVRYDAERLTFAITQDVELR